MYPKLKPKHLIGEPKLKNIMQRNNIISHIFVRLFSSYFYLNKEKKISNISWFPAKTYRIRLTS